MLKPLSSLTDPETFRLRLIRWCHKALLAWPEGQRISIIHQLLKDPQISLRALHLCWNERRPDGTTYGQFYLSRWNEKIETLTPNQLLVASDKIEGTKLTMEKTPNQQIASNLMNGETVQVSASLVNVEGATREPDAYRLDLQLQPNGRRMLMEIEMKNYEHLGNNLNDPELEEKFIKFINTGRKVMKSMVETLEQISAPNGVDVKIVEEAMDEFIDLVEFKS